VADLDALHLRIVEWLCRFEAQAPRTEHSMVFHLMLHLVDDIRELGPAKEYWMYSMER